MQLLKVTFPVTPSAQLSVSTDPDSGFRPQVLPKVTLSPAETRLLVVEDDEMVRSLVIAVLRDAGFSRLAEATDGVEGEEVYTCQGPFDMVITDILMPRLTGVELAFRLRELGHQGPVIFISAYADIARANEHVRMGDWHLIKKPFLPDTIVQTVNSLLGL